MSSIESNSKPSDFSSLPTVDFVTSQEKNEKKRRMDFSEQDVDLFGEDFKQEEEQQQQHKEEDEEEDSHESSFSSSSSSSNSNEAESSSGSGSASSSDEEDDDEDNGERGSVSEERGMFGSDNEGYSRMSASSAFSVPVNVF